LFAWSLSEQTTETGGGSEQYELESATGRSADRSQQTVFVSFGPAEAHRGEFDCFGYIYIHIRITRVDRYNDVERREQSETIV